MNRLRGAKGGFLCALLALQFFAAGLRESFAQTGPAPIPRATQPGDSVAATAERTKFVEKLLGEMTLAEKIGQLSQFSYKDMPRDVTEARIRSGEVGSLLFVTDPAEMNRLQKMAVTKSRLHIPLIYGFDVIHGFRTIDPVPLAMASSWDPAMVERTMGMAAKEARADGMHWAFSPMVDIARDSRWGRIMEGAGEDPYLGSAMAAAEVHGFQGPYVGSPDHILACVKHFAGYGAAVGGRDYEESDISEMTLRNVYLPPFHAAVKAGVATLMAAYEDINDVPASGNKFLLRDVLRDEWGFRGFVVSDWDTVHDLTTHGYTATPFQAAVAALNAGVDMEMTSQAYHEHLGEALKQGLVSEKTIDDAVRPILEMKYRLGLFADPYVSLEKAKEMLGAPEFHVASREAAERSAVLLNNSGGLLPLKRSIKKLAVIGPLADSKQDTLGSWSLASHPADTITVLEGLRRKLSAGTEILSTKGVEIARANASIFDDQFASPKPVLKTDAERDAEFQRAIAMVKEADVAVLVLGETQDMSGEHASRATLTLPGKQEELLEAAVATGKPVVLLLLNGRPLDINWAAEHVPSILEMWYPGSDGGLATANLLFGDVDPGGKLPVTWPRSAGQEPLYYNHLLTQDPAGAATRYWDMPSSPLYPFGYGLSYAKFEVGNLRLDKMEMSADGTVNVDVDVRNTSGVAGDEVVQLYVHQRAGSASRPVRELKGFRRVSLQAGEKQTVRLTLTPRDIAFWSPATRKWQAEPGVFDVWVGDDSTASLHGTFSLGGSHAIEVAE
jgi:beta-glucosidase